MAVLRGLLALLCVVSSAESQSFKAQSSQGVTLTPCRLRGVDGEARCGSYEVYEDRRARKGRRIALKIAVLPALGSKPLPEALFILAGGPGQPATENADFIARTFAKVRQERDIVMVDQRGTDESAVKRGKEQDRALLPAAPATGGVALNEDMQVRLYGETAVVTGRIVTKFKVGDQEIPGFTTRFTDTWLKRQGRWRVVARHYSRVPVERKAVKLDANIYDAYVGEYELAPGLALGVFKEGEGLFGQAAGQPKFELHPESEIIFFLKELPELFLFIRNDKGQVAQMLTIRDGRVTAAKKIK